MKKCKIVQVGWKDENNLVGMALLPRKVRDEVQVSLKDVVKVHRKLKNDAGEEIEITSLAWVQMQFKQHVGMTDSISINKVLADTLSVGTDDEVYVSKQVTESEYEAFLEDRRRHFMFGGEL